MSKHEQIKSWCPACKSQDTVFIGSGGYLTCSWVECPEPDFLKAWRQYLEDERGATYRMFKKEHDYWKDLAERLIQRPQLETDVRWLVPASMVSDLPTEHPDSKSRQAEAQS